MHALFDPRQIPVCGVDTHLPTVAAARLTPQALRQRFAAPPAWQPEVRREPDLPGASRPLAAAAVLMPLVQRPQGVTVLLTQRTAHLSSHAGQVAFPGGKADAEDASAAATALREAEEEVGLARRHVQVLGELAAYVTGTRYAVTPVVGLVQPGFALRPNPDEVAQVFEAPLAFLMNPSHHRRHQMADGRQWFSIPYTDEAGREHYIWGATAGMLRNLYRFLMA